MDTTNLQKSHHLLIGHLIKNKYGKDALGLTRRCIRLALDVGALPEITSYEDLFFREVEKCGFKPEEERYKHLRTYMGNVKQFDLKGIYPGVSGSPNRFLAPPLLYDQLNPVFQSAIDHHLEVGGSQGKRKKTVYTESRAAMNFFKCLQNYGAYTFQQVEDRMIYSFFFDGERQIRGKDYCRLVKRVLQTAIGLHGDAVRKILESLPAIKSGNKNFQYLTQEESARIRGCLENGDSGLTHLERSIGWMLYFLGLRGTDIMSLKPENIDWKHDRICLVQSKTEKLLTAPMNAAIGNELFDYITTERPEKDTKAILVSRSRPYGGLRCLGGIVGKIFDKAGVRTAGGARGLRVLRHHLVTYLLSRGVECEVVSSIVGHGSPESLKPYVDADIEHLRECAVSITGYPVADKLFDI